MGCLWAWNCARKGSWVWSLGPAFALLLGGCHSSRLPKPGSAAYIEEVKAFYVGLAALQVGDDVRADSTLQRATELAQGEPAGWANCADLRIRSAI